MLVKQKIKYIQSLGQKKFRREEKLFIAEGPKTIDELLRANAGSIQEIFAVKEWIDLNQQWSPRLTIHEVSEDELARISQLITPNKVLALVAQGDQQPTAIDKSGITLILDDIQDPGNLGTIIRTADWFGIEQIICSEETADLYNPKVVQSTMGSIARVKVTYTNLMNVLTPLSDIDIYVTSLDGRDISTIGKIQHGVIVIGNEAKGVNPAISALAKEKITILRKGHAESLNAAVATGIILSHLT